MAADSMAAILWPAQSHFLDAVLYNTALPLCMRYQPHIIRHLPTTSFGTLVYCERVMAIGTVVNSVC